MIRASRPLITLTFACVIALSTSHTPAAQRQYTLITLHGDSSQANSINNRRQIVGQYVNELGFAAPFVWQNGTLMPLDVLPDGQFGIAYDINDRGQIAGTGNSGDEGRAILWQDGVAIDLGTLPGGDHSEAYAINNRGIAAGVSTDSTLHFRPVQWVDGVAVDLGTGEFPAGWAYDINQRGDVVGTLIPQAGLETRAALWSDGEVIDLGVLYPDDTFSEALGINNRGQIVGISGNQPAGTVHAFIWENGAMRELAPPVGYAFARANDISDNGRVAGTFGNTHPIGAVWDGGTVTPLPTLDNQAHLAFAINERGDVVGYTSAGMALWTQAP